MNNPQQRRRFAATGMPWYTWNLLVVCLLSLAALGVPAFNLIVDPYGIFGMAWPRDSYSMNERFLKLEHVLQHKDTYDSFLVGSSVMGIYDPAEASRLRPGRSYYNLSFLAGTPAEAHAALRALKAQGVRVREVLMGVDIFAFRERQDSGKPARRQHPLVTGENRLAWFARYLFAPSILEGWMRIQHNLADDTKIEFDIAGGGQYRLVKAERDLSRDPADYIRVNLRTAADAPAAEVGWVDERFEEFRQLVHWLRANHVEARFFIHPFHQHFSNAISAASMAQFRQRITATAGPMPDYSKVQSITGDDRLYYDVKHYRPWVANRLMSELLSPTDSAPTPAGPRQESEDLSKPNGRT